MQLFGGRAELVCMELFGGRGCTIGFSAAMSPPEAAGQVSALPQQLERQCTKEERVCACECVLMGGVERHHNCSWTEFSSDKLVELRSRQTHSRLTSFQFLSNDQKINNNNKFSVYSCLSLYVYVCIQFFFKSHYLTRRMCDLQFVEKVPYPSAFTQTEKTPGYSVLITFSFRWRTETCHLVEMSFISSPHKKLTKLILFGCLWYPVKTAWGLWNPQT